MTADKTQGRSTKLQNGRSSENPLQKFKSIGPKLVPFIATLVLYVVIFIPVHRPSVLGMIIKCLPVISLALFVFLHGINTSATRVQEYKFSRRIIVGLLFSCLGDAFLVWPSYFLHGIVAFGVAQCFYIRAFGFEPLNWKVGAAVYFSTALNLGMIMPGLLKDELPVILAIPVYSFLLTTMLWRALSRIQSLHELFTWTKLCSCVGGLLFAISDTVLALDKFHAEVPNSQVIIMATYYLAQFGIALSIINPKGVTAGVKSSS